MLLSLLSYSSWNHCRKPPSLVLHSTLPIESMELNECRFGLGAVLKLPAESKLLDPSPLDPTPLASNLLVPSSLTDSVLSLLTWVASPLLSPSAASQRPRNAENARNSIFSLLFVSMMETRLAMREASTQHPNIFRALRHSWRLRNPLLWVSCC